MAKIKSSFANMVIALFIVCFVSSALLGYVYSVTKGPIDKAKLSKKISAIKKVVPEFTNNPLEEQYKIETEKGSLIFYPAKQNNSLVATAVETFSNNGFGGTMKIMVGFLPDGAINDVEVIEHSETPGLGDKINKSKSNFSQQFKGKNPDNFSLKVKKDGGDVDGITAATISSRAFTEAVQNAYLKYKEIK